MKLFLFGHDYKYAVEQMLLTMFPAERPEYPDEKPNGDRAELKLSRGAVNITATCALYINGTCFRGRAAIRNSALAGEILTDRHCQRLIKNAMYRAARNAGIKHPAWGALTGVRPGKVLMTLINSGLSEKDALKSFVEDYDVTPERAALCMDTTRETIKAAASLSERDICLYVGIPFCPTRCAYCSFVSQAVEKNMKLIEPFMNALMQELEATAAEVNRLGLRVVSVYMGGGTPTTLSAEQLDRLCTGLEKSFDLTQLREYTVEAGRPDTISLEKLRVLRAHGVDRVSVNPQTMSDKVLCTIGRRHTATDIVDALSKVREVGGFAVNMDLIAGLPDDSVEGFKETIEKVLALEPENITVHTLSLKKGSRIMLEDTVIPTAEEVSDMLDIAQEKLRGNAYAPYYLYRQKFMSGGFENVGWTKDGYINLYNICIMEELCSIVAMGGGGSTKLVAPGDTRNIRFIAPKYPQEYIGNIDKVCKDKEKISEFYREVLK